MNANRRARGNTMLEFTLCIVFLITLLSGMVVTGITLSRTVQAMTVSRDAGHMFARWVDFSVPSNQDMIVRVASGLNLVRSSTYNQGDGVVILTQVMYVDDAQCTGAGLTIAQCLNWRRNVIMKRVVIGNAGLRSSAYGTPLAALLGADGSLSSPDYLKEPSALVPLSAQLPQMAGGDFAYVSEACFNMPGLSLPYVAGGGVSYAQSIW